MAALVKEIAFETSHVNGMNLHILQTNKFKTTTIVVLIEQELSLQYATKTALLSLMLKRATARFPESKKLREHLDFLYGAVFDADVAKKGERQLLQIFMEVPNEKYLSESSSVEEQAFQFVGDVMARPYLENGVFAEKFLTTEKESLRQRIESVMNDKMRYANQRVTEEMFKGEPYAISVNGKVEDLAGITAQSLTDYYKELISENPIDIFVVGDVDRTRIENYVKTHITPERKAVKKLPVANESKQVQEIREVVERIDVNQAKLNIGARTNTTYKDDDYPAMIVMNGILGGFPHSKLFINVREKASLAYYAVSRLESHKGVLMMMSGIDANNYDKAVTIIKEQVEDMRQGNISETEMNQTKATLNNQFKEILDSSRLMIDFTYNGLLTGKKRELEELINQLNQVTVDDVKRVAAKVQLDTIYLLRDNKGGA
ncbi:EF-P 5-aminopentanol modification-associated protein YfmF [Brevibacillus dissolubilis]|uniref:EF-P 5-aminopentanol modification-associated protein YfmF n=1 Tax=Brevibacillus dissolubilis TaxID=1844116 RepID=UPI00111791B6|nr:pitrilysin family protein [Brevibacillus dissolubilis]